MVTLGAGDFPGPWDFCRKLGWRQIIAGGGLLTVVLAARPGTSGG
jgi:hypothetical protein